MWKFAILLSRFTIKSYLKTKRSSQVVFDFFIRLFGQSRVSIQGWNSVLPKVWKINFPHKLIGTKVKQTYRLHKVRQPVFDVVDSWQGFSSLFSNKNQAVTNSIYTLSFFYYLHTIADETFQVPAIWLNCNWNGSILVNAYSSKTNFGS